MNPALGIDGEEAALEIALPVYFCLPTDLF